MRQDPSPSSLARKTCVKWNGTLVNRWKKNNVALYNLYSPSNVRMLLWADAALFSSYEAVLPPAPPARSTSRESLLSAGRPVTSPAIPGDDGGDQDRGSPWSGFEEAIPPNQEARTVTPLVQTTQPPPEAVLGPYHCLSHEPLLIDRLVLNCSFMGIFFLPSELTNGWGQYQAYATGTVGTTTFPGFG